MSDDREASQTDDPRKQGTGQGYPESNPAGSTPKEGTDQGPESGTGGAEERSPDTHAGQDDDPGAATGNPNAAGG